MSEITFLLSRLEDPFEMFPMQSVSRSLADLVHETEEIRFERSAPMRGAAPKYYTVEDEHDIAVAGLLIGSAFVLGQAAITQTISIAKKIHDLAGKPSWLPHGKNTLMSTEASKHDKTGLSKITLIDAVANYFKHSYEWPDGWVGASQKQQDTINLVLVLGLAPSGDQNFETAMRELGVGAHDMAPLSVLVHEWRERLAAHFRGQMNKHGFDFHTSL
jgi:hypothetical protein